MRNPSRSLLLLLPLTLIFLFQNCSKNSFGSSSGGSSSSESAVTTNSVAACPDVLCAFDVTDLSEIELSGQIQTELGTFSLNLVSHLNSVAGTLVTNVNVADGSNVLASCSVSGSGSQVSAIETDLQNLTLSTTESQSGVSNFAALSVTFILKDGTQHSYRIDNNTTNVQVAGLPFINGLDLVSSLTQMAYQSSCASSI